MEDYDGVRQMGSVNDTNLPVELHHPTVRTVASVARRGKEVVLNAIQAFTEKADELVDGAEDEELDSRMDEAFDEHVEHLQAMSSMGICYSAMFSPTGECRKVGCKYSHERAHFKFAIVEQFNRLMKTPGYEDAVAAGLMESVKIRSDWDKAAPPPEARAARPLRTDRGGPVGRSVFPKPEGPGDNQIPFRTPQASRYATGQSVKPHKLHVTLAQGQNVSHIGESVSEELDSDSSLPATPEEEPDEVELFFDEFERESMVQRDGSRFYRMASVSVPDMPTTEVILTCPFNSVIPEFKVAAALDTCATGSYISESLANLLRPHLDPKAFQSVRSVVRMGAPPDHISTEQLTLKLRWIYQGVQRDSEVRFIILQSDNVQLILGLNAILHGGFLELLFDVLLKMKDRSAKASLLYLRDNVETNFLCMHRTLRRSKRRARGQLVRDDTDSPVEDVAIPLPPDQPMVEEIQDPILPAIPPQDEEYQEAGQPVPRVVVLEPGQSLQWVNAMDDDLRRYLQNRHGENSISPFYYMIATPAVPRFIYGPPVRVGPAGNIVLGEARAQHPADMDNPTAQAIRRAQEATLDAEVAARRARDYVAAARL